MKKIIIIFTIFIAFICVVWYIYNIEGEIQKARIDEYGEYQSLLNKPIEGTELATIMNKVIDKNEQNNVKKDKNGIYINNHRNSINIDIKFFDDKQNIKFENLEKNDISKFVQLYSDEKFELKYIDYHKSTKLVRYMHFEQVANNTKDDTSKNTAKNK